MRILQPCYYDEFECIAEKCRDSCCIGWHIYIDKKSFFKYKKIKGEFGNELKKKIKRKRDKKNDNEYSEMVLTSDSRCSLLNNDNLCDLYINKGKDYLCRTCKVYPRLINQYDNLLVERNVSLTCPVVAETLVKMKTHFEFVMKDEQLTELDETSRILWNNSSEIYNIYIKFRDLFIDIAQFTEIPIWKRLIFIKIAKESIEKAIDLDNYNNIEFKIQAIREYITNWDSIDLLDEVVEKHTNDKVSILLEIIGKINEGLEYPNKTFEKIVDNLINFAENELETNGFIKNKEIEFDDYLTEKEIILENYLVYNLYTNYMNALEDENIDKPIINLIISYSIIRLLLLSEWFVNNYTLTNDSIIDVLYSFSKVYEHQVSNIYDIIKQIGYDTSFYLSLFIY